MKLSKAPRGSPAANAPIAGPTNLSAQVIVRVSTDAGLPRPFADKPANFVKFRRLPSRFVYSSLGQSLSAYEVLDTQMFTIGLRFSSETLSGQPVLLHPVTKLVRADLQRPRRLGLVCSALLQRLNQ